MWFMSPGCPEQGCRGAGQQLSGAPTWTSKPHPSSAPAQAAEPWAETGAWVLGPDLYVRGPADGLAAEGEGRAMGGDQPPAGAGGER